MPSLTRYSLHLLGLLTLMVGPHGVSSRPGPPTGTHARVRDATPVNVNERPAQDIIDQLGLVPNNEKGYYTQSFEDTYTIPCLNRSASTAIYYLLEGTEGESVWHRVDAVEVWHYYAGAPLVLSLSYDDGQPLRKTTLGPDIFNDQLPQVAILKGEWQRARSLGKWTLVGTTVAPGFVPNGVQLADPGWMPSGC